MRKNAIQILVALAVLLIAAATVRPQAPAPATAKSTAAAHAWTAANATARPEDVGLSSERLKRISAAIQKSVDEDRIAGAVSLVARHGRIAYLEAVGMADREARKPMRTDSIYRICSMTKPLTSAAVMMLYEEGHFLLSDPVSDYLPEFRNMKVLDPPWPQDKTSPPGALVDAKRPITIFHLLTHTAGLTYTWNPRLGKVYRDANVGSGLMQQEGSIGESVQRLAKIPLLFQPGDDWEYSLSDDVLGRLVEVISGMPFDKFLEERLFKPLGMKDTAFFLPEEKTSRLPTSLPGLLTSGRTVSPRT